MIHIDKESERRKIVAVCGEEEERKEEKKGTIQKVCSGKRIECPCV